MNSRRRTVGRIAAAIIAMILVISSQMTAFAEQSDDNSLSSLGITTQGVTVSPDFAYDHLEYDVVVPAGTQQLDLDPVLSNPNATINSIEGTTLTNGAGTVKITTTAPSGAMTMYTLNVTSASATDTNVDPAQAIAAQEQQTAANGTQPSTTAQADVAQQQENAAAAAQSETQSESETEDSRYVKVDKNTLQDAENTITRLQKELQDYKDRSHQFTYIIYALIAASIVLLFLVVNLIIRKRDLAAELKQYRKKKLPEGFEDSADVIPEDGWLDDEPEKSSKKKNRKVRSVPQYSQPDGRPAQAPSMTRDGRMNAQTSWTEQQVGTPVQPPREVTQYNGYARSSQAGKGSQAARGNQAVRSGQAVRGSEEDASGRVLGEAPRQSHVSDDTKLYRVQQAPARDAEVKVPGGETIVLPGKKLTRAEKAAAKKAAKEAKKAQKAQKSVWEQAPDGEAASGKHEYAGTMPAQSEVKTSDMPDIRPNAPMPYKGRGAASSQQAGGQIQAGSGRQGGQTGQAAPQGGQMPQGAPASQKPESGSGVKVDMIDL